MFILVDHRLASLPVNGGSEFVSINCNFTIRSYMMIALNSMLKRAAFISAVPFVLSFTVAMAQNPDTTTLPNGAELSVEIFNPTSDLEFRVPANADGSAGGTINVSTDGEASVGEGEPNIMLVYVLDVSGSTIINSCMGGTILDCEVQAIMNVQADPNISSVKEFGVAIFADGGNTADMPGLKTSVPGNVDTVVLSAFSSSSGGAAGVNAFSPRTVGAGQTDLSSGLQNALSILGVSTSATDRVIYLSDGGSTQQSAPGGFAGQLAAMVANGAVVDAFAVGLTNGCSLGSAGTLQQIGDATGGTCTNVDDPADLPDLLPNLLATSLDALTASLDGLAVATDTVPAVLPVDGPIAASYSSTYLGLGIGDYGSDAEATGSDSVGSDAVTANDSFHLLQLIASPFTAINELSEDNAHTVFGQILGGTGPDRDIVFLVSGTNAATATPGGEAINATPGGAAVDFGYTVPVSCDSLGQDTITVSTTIGGGPDSIDLTKDWVDTIAPVAECVETTNPNGNNKPKAPGGGDQGQNQDGFYELLATDNLIVGCDPLVLFVLDDGSGTVFGPFAVGTKIKYTQDDEAIPEISPMGGNNGNGNGNGTAVDWHIIGNGDAQLTALDQSGNESDPVSCLVPPPPQ